MTDLKTTDEAAIAVSAENLKRLDANPLLAVPPYLRKPVFAAWMMYRHLPGFESPSPVAFAVAVWVNQHGIDPGRVFQVLAEVTHPKHMRAIRFASDFTATLAELLTPPETPAEWAARITRRSPLAAAHGGQS